MKHTIKVNATAFGVALCFFAAGCNQIFSLKPEHLATDSGVDLGSSADATRDATSDVRDAVVADAPFDAGADQSVDAGRDASADSPSEARADVPSDRPAGDGGLATDAGTDRGPTRSCQGTQGPTPINIDNRFCVDSTPVTNDQYAAFLAATAQSPVPQPVGCQWNAVFTPDYFPYSATVGSLPVRDVDFCDAWSYCQWAGKRLCGVLDHQGSSISNFDRVLDGELYYACSGGAGHPLTYSYSSDGTVDPTACDTDVCNGTTVTKFGQIDPVGNPRCQSIVYPGLYDLNSAVEVWLDMCLAGDATDGSGDTCRLSTPLFCDQRCDVSGNGAPRNAPGAGTIGMRCCSDLD